MPVDWIADAHADTVLASLERGAPLAGPSPGLQTDLARMGAIGQGLQILSLWVEPRYKPERALPRFLQLLDHCWGELARSPDRVQPVLWREDLERARREGRISLLIHMEGGEPLGTSPATLRLLYALGLRSVGLTWNERNPLADGCAETRSGGGLSEAGREIVAEMERLGILLDLAHLSPAGFRSALEAATRPPYCTHTAAHALCPHRRNLADDQARALAERGGWIGIAFAPEFLRPGGKGADLAAVCDHVEHLVRVAGTAAVGLGADFDGIEAAPAGLEEAGCLPRLAEALRRRGLPSSVVAGVMGENLYRYLVEQLPSPPPVPWPGRGLPLLPYPPPP